MPFEIYHLRGLIIWSSNKRITLCLVPLRHLHLVIETILPLNIVLIGEVLTLLYYVILKLLDFIRPFSLTKVYDLDVIVGIKHDIPALDVSMHYLIFLHVLREVHHLGHMDLGKGFFLLVHLYLSNQLIHSTLLRGLRHEIKIFVILNYEYKTLENNCTYLESGDEVDHLRMV